MRNKNGNIHCGKQKGVAILIALMVVALIATIAIELTWKMNLSLTRSENRWYGVQANTYLEGAENLAIKWLTDDLNDGTSASDNLKEDWAQPVPQMPTDHGYVSGAIEDASARFNLNSMVSINIPGAPPPPQSGAGRFTEAQRRFVRLLQLLVDQEGKPLVNQADAEAITEAVMDWIDRDDKESGFGGAEADYYQQLIPPFVIANGIMSSVSELSLIKGVTPQIYNALLPHVIVLPPDAALNLNTVPEMLIRTLNFERDLTPLSKSDAQLLLQEREQKDIGYEIPGDFVTGGTAGATVFPKHKNAFTGLPGGPGGAPPTTSVDPTLDMTGLNTKSDYFILSSETMVGDHIRTRRTLIKRDRNTKVVVAVRRTDANF